MPHTRTGEYNTHSLLFRFDLPAVVGTLVSAWRLTAIIPQHYKQAYNHVLDLRMHDTNLLEVKTIGGFVNYKVPSCNVLWALG